MFPLTDSFLKVMNILFYSVYVMLTIAFVGGCVGLYRRRKYLHSSKVFGRMLFPWEAFVRVTLGPLLALELWRWQIAFSTLPSPKTRVMLGMILVCLLSILLFVLKVKALKLYATVESAFALIVCYKTLDSMADVVQPVQLLGLFTSAYLIIRGLDNFRKGLEAGKQQRPSV